MPNPSYYEKWVSECYRLLLVPLLEGSVVQKLAVVYWVHFHSTCPSVGSIQCRSSHQNLHKLNWCFSLCFLFNGGCDLFFLTLQSAHRTLYLVLLQIPEGCRSENDESWKFDLFLCNSLEVHLTNRCAEITPEFGFSNSDTSLWEMCLFLSSLCLPQVPRSEDFMLQTMTQEAELIKLLLWRD